MASLVIGLQTDLMKFVLLEQLYRHGSVLRASLVGTGYATWRWGWHL